ncbi:TPA: hypothetical protein SIF59_004282 [Escherichia coli]|jgi:hypothetical protein|nr:hypothetical protein [Escherichia coli]
MSNRAPTVLKNKVGVTFCYLQSSVTSSGGGTYITRALDARKETGADVIVFLLPHSENAEKNMERIKRGREDLMSAVKPLILPFKICVAIGATAEQFHKSHEGKQWSEIKY